METWESKLKAGSSPALLQRALSNAIQHRVQASAQRGNDQAEQRVQTALVAHQRLRSITQSRRDGGAPPAPAASLPRHAVPSSRPPARPLPTPTPAPRPAGLQSPPRSPGLPLRSGDAVLPRSPGLPPRGSPHSARPPLPSVSPSSVIASPLLARPTSSGPPSRTSFAEGRRNSGGSILSDSAPVVSLSAARASRRPSSSGMAAARDGPQTESPSIGKRNPVTDSPPSSRASGWTRPTKK